MTKCDTAVLLVRMKVDPILCNQQVNWSFAVLTLACYQSVLLIFILTRERRENEYVYMKAKFAFLKLEKY